MFYMDQQVGIISYILLVYPCRRYVGYLTLLLPRAEYKGMHVFPLPPSLVIQYKPQASNQQTGHSRLNRRTWRRNDGHAARRMVYAIGPDLD